MLIEKLLRANPEIGKIFVLMKSKDQELANKRLYDEVYILISSLIFTLFLFHLPSFSFFLCVSLWSTQIIRSDLFKVLKQIHGTSYEDFMKSKLIPVLGDIGEENLGIEYETADKISEEIDVIVSCAGRTTFDDRCFLCIFIACKLTVSNLLCL